MRLRRETGDFQIKVISGTANTIRKGLSAEDFVGELVSVDGVFEVISSASNGEGTVTAKSESYILTYNKETGAITAEQNSGGGSGGGSGLVIEGARYAYDAGLERDVFTMTDPIATGLTVDDFINAAIKATYVLDGTEIPTFFAVIGARNETEAEWGSDPQSWPSYYTGEEIRVAVSLGTISSNSSMSLAYRPSTGEVLEIS